MGIYESLHVANAQRVERWHPGFANRTDSWSGADWANAMQGEAGEAGNVVKKIRRIECGLKGNRTTDQDLDRLRRQLAMELADTFIYLDLLAQYYDIDLPEAVQIKFNKVSAEKGFPERL